jgi:histidinol-phosphate aminotransferase
MSGGEPTGGRPPVPVRHDLRALTGYHSPQVTVEVRLNTNESPLPPPPGWLEDLRRELGDVEFNRYPDRDATELRRALGELHGVEADRVFCANGSNEVLQCLLLAFGGANRRALVFEPTYALHGHIARLTGTDVVVGGRDAELRIDPVSAAHLLDEEQPQVVFVCSPNNPTGRLEDPAVVTSLVRRAGGLVVVDEAYGQFADWSALELDGSAGSEGLVVVRTFSKTWAMAGARLGYLVAHPDVVDGCRAAALPYHLSVQTQLAGALALRHRGEMEARVRQVAEGRAALAAGLALLEVDTWPSDANFVLFRPRNRPADEVWKALLADGVLVRDFSSVPGLEGCLRVTVGTDEENGRFLEALGSALA